MDQQQVEGGHASNESDDKANKKTIEWSHILDWGFWTGHPLAVFAMFLGGILLASITSFPGGNPRALWYFAAGLWIVCGTIIWWVFAGIIARMEGKELLTTQEIEQRDAQYRDGIQAQFNALRERIGETQKSLAEQQRRRRLTAAQKEVIKVAIAPFAGQSIRVSYPMNDAEASQYAEDFAETFRDAGWKCEPIRGVYSPAGFDNVVAAMSGKTPPGTPPPKSLNILIWVLMELGLSKNRGLDPSTQVNRNENLAVDQLELRVEPKMPLAESTTK